MDEILGPLCKLGRTEDRNRKTGGGKEEQQEEEGRDVTESGSIPLEEKFKV